MLYFYNKLKPSNNGVVYDIHNDMQNLKHIRKEGNTCEFYEAVNAIMDKYSETNFNPDLYFPNKVLFKELLFHLEDNLRSIELLGGRGLSYGAYYENVVAIRQIVDQLRDLKWIKYDCEDNEDEDTNN